MFFEDFVKLVCRDLLVWHDGGIGVGLTPTKNNSKSWSNNKITFQRHWSITNTGRLEEVGFLQMGSSRSEPQITIIPRFSVMIFSRLQPRVKQFKQKQYSFWAGEVESEFGAATVAGC